MMQIRLKKICQLAIYTVRRTQSFVSRFAPYNGTTDVMAVFKLPRPIYTVRDRNPPNMIHIINITAGGSSGSKGES